MRPSDDEIAGFVTREWIPTALCWLSAMPIFLLGLFLLLVQWLANMNLDCGRTPHCVIFVVGWLTVMMCFYTAYRLVRYSSYRSLWFALLAALMIGLDWWLYSLPAAKGLMH